MVHGSGACGLAVRRWLLENPCDCLAVPLPDSFRHGVVDAIASLPNSSIVIQKPLASYSSEWSEADDGTANPATTEATWSYVPIDPCQPVIMALRMAMGEHWNIEFCDLKPTSSSRSRRRPNGYALREVPLERFATAVLPSLPRPVPRQVFQRLQYMAWRLRQQRKHRHIVMLCSLLEWPWLRESYHEPENELPQHDTVEFPTSHPVNPNSLLFLFGELPYMTGLYEQARAQMDSDENLAIDGVKHLLMSARSSYLQDFGKRARKSLR